jgi:hypothetical protein
MVLKGKIKTFDPRGSTGTSPNAIADDGSIVGAYAAPDTANFHGFFRAADGTIISFDVPNSSSTVPLSINSSDVVTGLYEDGSGSHGFIRTPDGTITTFDEPDAQGDTHAEAIDGNGDVSGTYWTGAPLVGYGFVRAADGTFTSFQLGSELTFPFTSNKKGEMAGFWEGANDVQHGFLRQPSGKMERFDVPDSIQTTPSSINNKGIIVGAWWDTNYISHGFLRTP